jgi:hypothetical protein
MARFASLVTFTMFLVPLALLAQAQRDLVPLKSWPAPLYFQPSPAESREHAKPEAKPEPPNALSSDATTSLAATPAGSLVFVAMTPCRIADTRDAGYPAGFGPPSLVGNASRTFAIQSLSSPCPVPSIAQAYSFNVTAVPPGTTFPGNVNPSGALGHLTIWPTGVPQPVVSTLNSFLGTVVANAAIVPAGTGGSVNVFVSQSTDLIIDINGYYAPQSGITLAQGTAAAPTLSFSGDPGTGIFSSGAGTLNVATSGSNRLSVDPSGNVGIGTNTPAQSLEVEGITSLGPAGSVYGYSVNGSTPGPYPTIGFNAYGPTYIAGTTGYGGILQFQNGNGSLIYYTGSNVSAGTPHATPVPRFTIAANGLVGIGTTTPGFGLLDVEASGSGDGVYGFSSSGRGITGASPNGYGVYGTTGVGYAGYFQGPVNVTGCISASNLSCPSDARLKENITPLSYGLPEVLRLRPVTWQWKDATRTEPKLGFVAQDVEPVMPELVIQNADNKGALGLNYMGLVPVTINAIQQQQAQIEDQQKVITEQREAIGEQQQEIRDQKEQNRKLEERLAAVEKLLATIQPSTADR